MCFSECFRLFIFTDAICCACASVVGAHEDIAFTADTQVCSVFFLRYRNQLFWKTPLFELNWLEGAWCEVLFTRPAAGTTIVSN